MIQLVVCDYSVTVSRYCVSDLVIQIDCWPHRIFSPLSPKSFKAFKSEIWQGTCYIYRKHSPEF